MTKDDEKMLDATFAQVRAEAVAPTEGLLDRIMFDADQVLAVSAPSLDVAPAAKVGLGAMVLEALGGWPSLSGLAAATVAGVWIGVSPPDALSDLSAGFWGTTYEVPLLENDVLAALEG